MIWWICSVNRAFINSCSAWGNPRSAKTFPLPSETLIFLADLRLVVIFGADLSLQSLSASWRYYHVICIFIYCGRQSIFKVFSVSQCLRGEIPALVCVNLRRRGFPAGSSASSFPQCFKIFPRLCSDRLPITRR